MRAVIIEGIATNPGDISWDPISSQLETTIYPHTSEADKWEQLKGADVVIANKILLNEEVFSRFPQIRYVGECATGINNVDLEAAHRHGVTVTYAPAYSTASVVQHAFALLLELTNKVSLHDASVKAGDWVASETFCYWKAPLIELADKTMGIVGFGNIGRGVARVAQALGMRVLVHTAHPARYVADACDGLRFVSLDELLGGSDVISLHCPLTEDTRELVRAETIERMRDGVFILNLARGPVVNEHDLAAALACGKVGGAGVDVVEREPMRANNPLLTAPNIVITPHVGWASVEARTRLVDTVAANLAAWLKGTPQNVVS
ncbi:MAG: D-2-hydroxyacid dehydrogenase [Coriobacteriales bacterium]|nr:D-2-hydroxyacid dehydrogenase [Coriobacteriales bacterium]